MRTSSSSPSIWLADPVPAHIVADVVPFADADLTLKLYNGRARSGDIGHRQPGEFIDTCSPRGRRIRWAFSGSTGTRPVLDQRPR
jgi:hypothetical protein